MCVVYREHAISMLNLHLGSGVEEVLDGGVHAGGLLIRYCASSNHLRPSQWDQPAPKIGSIIRKYV